MRALQSTLQKPSETARDQSASNYRSLHYLLIDVIQTFEERDILLGIVDMTTGNSTRALERLSLLVVDDDPLQSSLISRAGQKAGFHVVQVHSSKDAISVLEKQSFSCITLDLLLGDGDGMEVMRKLATANYEGPVIIISGTDRSRRSESRREMKGLNLQLLQSFKKPIDLAALRISLASLRRQLVDLPPTSNWGEARSV